MTEDKKIGKIDFRKGDQFFVNFYALHYDGTQWQKPLEFIPERFDHSNPISLTPDGKKRNPYSFVPFAGGKRVCFGKTFAESALKITATYLTQAFNLQFVDKYYETQFPIAQLSMSSRCKIEVILTKNI